MKEKISIRFQKLLFSESGDTFRNFIFGFQDGLISTYVLLAGIAILVFSNPTLLLITLLAEIAAGAISMGFGAFTSTKTKNEYLIKSPSNDKNETLRKEKFAKFSQKIGLNSKEIETIENSFRTNPDLWEKIIKFQLEDSQKRDPVNNAIYMACAFVLGGILPVIPYFIPIATISFIIATILSFCALFIVGIFRSFFSEKHWLKPALEMILIGILATIIIEIYLYIITIYYGLVLIS